MTKEALRKIYLDKRQALTETETAALNLQLYHLFFSSIDLSFLKVVHVYLPLKDKNEPDTWMIIDRIRREFPHVRISLPRVEGNTLHHLYFEGLHQLQTSKWGIQEPQSGSPTPVEKIDLVIVPLVIFDKQGHRVGYGKGFYDQFLAACRPGCQKIGLSFFNPVDRIADTHDGDALLTGCLTPSALVSF